MTERDLSEQARRAFAASLPDADIGEAIAEIDAPLWDGRVRSWTDYVSDGYRDTWPELLADVRLAVYVHATTAYDVTSAASERREA